VSDPWNEMWNSPEAQQWIKAVLEEMYPKLGSSKVSLMLLDQPEGSPGKVKFWVELGASIMLDKPIIVLAEHNQSIPSKLDKLADKVIRFDPDNLEASANDLQKAFKEVIEK
jgi:hypothetical protein